MIKSLRSPKAYKIASRSRSGVSPVIATTIIIAITVTLGLALWAYANASVGSATQTYSESVIEYGKLTRDRFVIANIDFDNPPTSGDIAFWVYNSGKDITALDKYLIICRNDISICAADPNPSDPLVRERPIDITDPTDCALCVKSHSLEKFTFHPAAIEGGKTYELTIYSETGASTTLLKKWG